MGRKKRERWMWKRAGRLRLPGLSAEREDPGGTVMWQRKVDLSVLLASSIVKEFVSSVDRLRFQRRYETGFSP